MDKQAGEARKQVSREEVKQLAIAIGVTKAAQELGLSEVRVRQWSSRGKWFSKEPKPVPPSYAVTTVTSPSDALQSILEDDSKETKLSLSKGVRKAANYIGNKLEGVLLVAGADKVKHIVGAASQLHGWEQQRTSSNLDINVLAGGRAMIQVVTNQDVKPSAEP